MKAGYTYRPQVVPHSVLDRTRNITNDGETGELGETWRLRFVGSTHTYASGATTRTDSCN